MTKRLRFAGWLACLSLLAGCGGNTASTNSPPPSVSMAITSGTLPPGTAGMPYDGSGFVLTASGGVAPYHWTWVPQTKSSVPDGISMTPDGLISGTPRLAGAYKVTVTVVDAGLPPSQVSMPYTIGVAGPLALTITSGNPPGGTAGMEYGPSETEVLFCRWTPVLGWHMVCTPCSSVSVCQALPTCSGIGRPMSCRGTKTVFLGFTFTAGGGVAPYNWSAVGLPSGLTLDPSTGRVTGTPTQPGSYTVTITANDSQPSPALVSADYVMDVANP